MREDQPEVLKHAGLASAVRPDEERKAWLARLERDARVLERELQRLLGVKALEDEAAELHVSSRSSSSSVTARQACTSAAVPSLITAPMRSSSRTVWRACSRRWDATS